MGLLFALGAVFAWGGPAAGDWGEAVDGLQIRATADATAEQRGELRVSFEVRSERFAVDMFEASSAASLGCGDGGGGGTHWLGVIDHGMPTALNRGNEIVDSASMSQVRVEAVFHLVRLQPWLEPGTYACRVRWARPSGGSGVWSGQVLSAPFEVAIVPSAIEARTFVLPRALSVSKGAHGPRIAYGEGDAEVVSVQTRRGMWIGGEVLVDGRRSGLYSFWMAEADGMREIFHQGGLGEGPWRWTITVRVFETADPPVHLWHPGPGSGAYRVLWERDFDVAFDREGRAL